MSDPSKRLRPVSDDPIGIFDSGIGGLSVLQHLRQQLPAERLFYFADAGFAPYGEKPAEFIVERSVLIAEFLLARGIKALVVACNTATARAISVLRERFPDLIIIGIEPGLKPAAQLSRNKRVGVMATLGTLQSAKFSTLRDQVAAETGAKFFALACVGLATQIEKAELDSPTTARLVKQYVSPLLAQDIDTLVLGCTHYPFVTQLILQQILAHHGNNDAVRLIDTGEAVARHLCRQLQQRSLLAPLPLAIEASQRHVLPVHAWSNGSVASLRLAFEQILGFAPTHVKIEVASGLMPA